MDHPKTVYIIASPPASARQLRVAGYCRTSTTLDSQKTSLASQRTHYRDVILSNPAWELAGIYAESGVSATNASTRPELQRLIADCRNGLVDLVITKSLSRFARNTADCLTITRQLTSLGVALWFEKENIHTDREESELMLSVLSALAQDESRSLSANVKWGIQRRFEAGTYLPSRVPYGYRKLGRSFEVHPQEASVVRGIFAALLEGEGPTSIARNLNARGVPTWTQANRAACDAADGSACERTELVSRGDARGNAHSACDKPCNEWRASTVRDMVQNLFYTGDVLYQKTFVDDRYRKQRNTGQLARYVHREHHPALVSRDTFTRANRELERRGTAGQPTRADAQPAARHEDQSSTRKRRYCFSGKLVCGACGATLYRGGTTRPFYRCPNRSPADSPSRCAMPAAYVDDLQNALATMFNKLAFGEKALHLLRDYAGAPARHQALSLRADVMARGVCPTLGEDGEAIFLRHVDKAVVWSRHRVECHFTCGLLLCESLVPTEVVPPSPVTRPDLAPAPALAQRRRTIPFGYRMRDGRIVPDPNERRQLTALFSAFVAGDSLNACRAKAGISRAPQTCKRMLANTLYAGSDQYPPLVSSQLFYAAQNELARRDELRSQQARALPKRRHTLHVPVITRFRILSDNGVQGTLAKEPPAKHGTSPTDALSSASHPRDAALRAALQYARIQGTDASTLKGGPRDSSNN
ncbi:MAG: recombinase family protein [Atopobiaceae bacterium]|nr:recombinase family protein [Atopobiaceae bacterium]